MKNARYFKFFKKILVFYYGFNVFEILSKRAKSIQILQIQNRRSNMAN